MFPPHLSSNELWGVMMMRHGFCLKRNRQPPISQCWSTFPHKKVLIQGFLFDATSMVRSWKAQGWYRQSHRSTEATIEASAAGWWRDGWSGPLGWFWLAWRWHSQPHSGIQMLVPEIHHRIVPSRLKSWIVWSFGQERWPCLLVMSVSMPCPSGLVV